MSLPTIDAWSISALLEFEQCAHRAYLRRIAKSPLPELPDTHPMVRGSRIHKEVEEYISGVTDEFPASGKKLRQEIEHCREQYQAGNATVEDQWGFDAEWGVLEGWFVDGIWCRMATDCAIYYDNDAVEIFDWKTGKSFGNEVKYMQQMQLYAIGAFLRNPELLYATVTLGFLDDGTTRTKSFERDKKLFKLIERFTERGKRMTECVDFRPKPSVQSCKWCPFGPGGTDACLHGVEAL